MYTSGINDAEYTNTLLVILFVIMNLLSSVKVPANSVIEFSGDFEKTRLYAIWEMIINLTVSIVAIIYFGICGAIIGTIVALIYRGIVTIYYSNKKILSRSQMHTYKIVLVNMAVFAVIMAVFFVDTFSGVSFVKLLINGIIHSIWIVGLYLTSNFVFNKSAFKTLFEMYRGNKKI